MCLPVTGHPGNELYGKEMMLTDPEKKLPCSVAGSPSAQESGEKNTHTVVYWSPPLPPEVRQLLNERIREAGKFGPVIMTGVQHPDMFRADEEKE